MNTNRFISLCTIFLILFFSNESFSQTPTYQLTAKNFNRTAQDSLTFDIYILHSNPSAGVFEYSLGQYFFRFNPNIANGGTLTYRILDSGLPTLLRPRNPSISGNELRLATNSAPGAGNGHIVSSVSPGTLIIRMSLRTTASSFSPTENLNLTWKNIDLGNPYTKVFAYVGTNNTEITNPANHIIDKMVNLNSLSLAVPEEYSLEQNYPNPFNPSTKIKFSIPESGLVIMKIYDVRGRLVNEILKKSYNAGNYEVEFSGRELSSGIYYYSISVNDFIQTRRMTIIK